VCECASGAVASITIMQNNTDKSQNQDEEMDDAATKACVKDIDNRLETARQAAQAFQDAVAKLQDPQESSEPSGQRSYTDMFSCCFQPTIVEVSKPRSSAKFDSRVRVISARETSP